MFLLYCFQPVVTRWKFYRSSTSMQFSDFQKLDLIVRRELSREPDLLSKLPGGVMFRVCLSPIVSS